MDNFRKRQERIYADRVQREKRELLGKVLEVVDNLDRALRFQDTMDRDGLQQGLRMLQWQLNELLKGEGLTPVPTVGQTFDPYVHDAIESVASDDYPEGVVVEEVRRGYKLGDETLRPARVKVSSGANAEGDGESNAE
jgi:molecular chaperone GrpE